MIRFLARAALSAASGVLLYCSFPPVGWWWSAVLGLAVLTVGLAPWPGDTTGVLRKRAGALLGFICGTVFFLLLIPWVGLYVGGYAAWALSVVQGLYFAAFGAGTVAIIRTGCGHASTRATSVSQLAALCAMPLGVAGWWSLWEWIRSSWPWGGFPWGRLAFGQADGPFLHLAALGGAPLVGFLVCAIGVSLGIGLVLLLRGRGVKVPVLSPIVTIGIVTSLLFVLAEATTAKTGGEGEEASLRIAVIQGNVPRLGLDFNSQRRAVLDNHVRESLALADRIDSGKEPRPDIVFWPENASDISPLHNGDAAGEITEASRRLGAPILVGTVLPVENGPQATNSYFVWDGARGPVDRHDKRYIQPFGEWLPMRGLFETLFPIAKSAGHFVSGTGTGLVTAKGVGIGVATCYEIAFPQAARQPVELGAKLLAVPTNNATFGRSPMTYQQLAMSRVRAVENNVPVVIAATSGVSAIIDRDGRVSQQSQIFEPAVLTATLKLDGNGSVATRLGNIPEAVCCLLGLLALVGVAWRRIFPRRNTGTVANIE